MSGRGRVLKIVTVGDGAVGKTCLLIAHTSGAFEEDYVPTIFDNYAGAMTVDNEEYNYTLWDTAGQEGFDRCRVLSYTETSVFIVCFDVNKPVSLENVKNVWVPEVRQECGQHVPILLVGTKIDLRDGKVDKNKVNKAEGRKVARALKLHGYVECSAKTCTGCDEVMQEAIRATFPPRPSGGCTLL